LAKLTIDSLRGSDNVPLFLTRVTQEREGIERALKDGFLKPGFAACRAFLRWRSACRAVQKEADLLEVDGCWYLFHIHKAGDDSPSQRTKCAKAIMQPDLGVGQLEPIGAAASSMVGWVTEKAYPSDDRKPMESPVRGGGANATEPTPCEVAERLSTPSTVGEMNGGNPPPADTTVNPRLAKKAKRSTERGEGRVKLIAALTKHHKYADDGCLNLEPVGNNELARLAGVSESTASAFFNREFRGHTRYRAVCRDSAQLVVSLKTLNREYSPCHLYGGKPLGEDDCDDKG
jgi:hypothetical protein